jgi:hypothetical protein
MAIDMIENNDLGALAPSRLGLNEFVDDNWAYKNYTGEEDFFNLFGSRKKKMDKYTSWARAKFESLSTDCGEVQKSIDIINNELQLLLKKKQTLNVKTQIKETNQILADFKRAQIEQDCENKLAQTKAEKEKADTLSTLTQLSDISVGKAQQELAGLQAGAAPQDAASQAQMKKYLMYGGIGLGAVLLIFLIARR